jgi:uncharacterized protein (UPF0335 family)
MSRLQEHVENIRRKLERLESEEANLKRAIQETMKKIDSHKSLVEKNVQAFSGQEITVKVWG